MLLIRSILINAVYYLYLCFQVRTTRGSISRTLLKYQVLLVVVLDDSSTTSSCSTVIF